MAIIQRVVTHRPRSFVLVVSVCGVLALAIALRAPQHAPSQGSGSCATGTGRLAEEDLRSSALQAAIPVLIYLPPCYRAGTPQRYPVLYLLHGAGADQTQWDDVGIDETADRLIADGAIPSLLMVLPGGNCSGDPTYDRFVVDELIPFIDVSYPTRAERDSRAIGGISMGGRSAFAIAMAHPGWFGSVGGHSPALGNVEDLAGLRREPMRIWLDVGDADGLAASVERFAQQLERAGLPVTW